MTNQTSQSAAVKPALIDNLATLFANSNKDYYFGLIPDSNLFELRLDAINDFLDYLQQFSISGKFMALQRLAACYATHSTDGKIQRETLSDLIAITKLLEVIATREADIEVWANFTGVLSEEIANNNQ